MGAMKHFIEEVWNLYCDGYTVREIAERYGCEQSDVRHAIWTFCEFGMQGDRQWSLLFLRRGFDGYSFSYWEVCQRKNYYYKIIKNEVKLQGTRS